MTGNNEIDREALLTLEQNYLDALLMQPKNKRYNITVTAGSPLGYTHTAATLKRKSEINSGELNPMYGKRHEKNPQFNKKGRTHSVETILKIRNATKGRKYGGKKVEVFNVSTQLFKVYETKRDVINDLRLSFKTLEKYAKSGEVYNGLYTFKIIEKN